MVHDTAAEQHDVAASMLDVGGGVWHSSLTLQRLQN